jgi:hypothetical protein
MILQTKSKVSQPHSMAEACGVSVVALCPLVSLSRPLTPSCTPACAGPSAPPGTRDCSKRHAAVRKIVNIITVMQGTVSGATTWLCMCMPGQTTGLPAVLCSAAPQATPHSNGDPAATTARSAALIICQDGQQNLTQGAGAGLARNEALDMGQLLRGTLQERLQLTSPVERQEMLHMLVGRLQDGCALMAVAGCPCTETKRGHSNKTPPNILEPLPLYPHLPLPPHKLTRTVAGCCT